MVITTREFAEHLNLTTERIRQLIVEGQIKAEKHGRDYLIDDNQIELIRLRPDNRGKHKRNKSK